MLARVDYSGLGRRMRAMRKYFHLTQEQLAEIIGVSVQYIGNLERGVSIPSVDMLMSVCYAFEVSPNYLLMDSLPEGDFPEPPPSLLRSPGCIFCNTLSDWLLEDDAFTADAPVDLSKLPPIPFMTLDESFSHTVFAGR